MQCKVGSVQAHLFDRGFLQPQAAHRGSSNRVAGHRIFSIDTDSLHVIETWPLLQRMRESVLKGLGNRAAYKGVSI